MFYVYKEGRCVSDYDEYEDAVAHAERIDGEVASDIDTNVPMD